MLWVETCNQPKRQLSATVLGNWCLFISIRIARADTNRYWFEDSNPGCIKNAFRTADRKSVHLVLSIGRINHAKAKHHRTNHVCKGKDDGRGRTRKKHPPLLINRSRNLNPPLTSWMLFNPFSGMPSYLLPQILYIWRLASPPLNNSNPLSNLCCQKATTGL